MVEAFYEHDRDDRFVATKYTRGPWDPGMQHGGPPAALIARSLTDVESIEGQVLARVTFEILRPVPIGPVRITADVPRPGKKVSMATAVMTDDDGQELILARAWRLQPTPEDLAATGASPAVASLEGAQAMDWFTDDAIGFQTGVEVRFTAGGFTHPGPATAWFRMAVPLVYGTPWRATDPLFVAADCGNGISAEIDFLQFLFINTDLQVSIARMPAGEWVCLDARTNVTPGGVTTAVGTLHDERGLIGRALQTLYVGAR